MTLNLKVYLFAKKIYNDMWRWLEYSALSGALFMMSVCLAIGSFFAYKLLLVSAGCLIASLICLGIRRWVDKCEAELAISKKLGEA